jgi:hypothetical protein
MAALSAGEYSDEAVGWTAVGVGDLTGLTAGVWVGRIAVLVGVTDLWFAVNKKMTPSIKTIASIVIIILKFFTD